MRTRGRLNSTRTGRRLGPVVAVAACLVAALATAAPAEAWSSRAERPPRKGDLYYVDPPSPAVNFLVPRGERARYAKPTPWTKEWFAYCAARWPSFDPRTGTIRTADGVRMCI